MNTPSFMNSFPIRSSLSHLFMINSKNDKVKM
jgi:hypothetical protein